MTAADGWLVALAELGARIAATTDVEDVVDTVLLGVDELLGFTHSLLLVHEPETDRLVTLASRGYDTGGIGSEVAMGQGVIGMAAERRRPMRIGNLQRMLAYARTVQRAADDELAGTEILLPGLPDASSQLAAPIVARGVLVGVVAVESPRAVAFDEDDEHALAVVGHLAGAALEHDALVADVAVAEEAAVEAPVAAAARPAVRLRHYDADGSTFLDDAYVIKGVAGRLLWKLAGEHVATGRRSFTNREARLDPALGLPAWRDNFESRLILLKRRLEERGAPVRIVGAGRGCFELVVDVPLDLQLVGG
ncbi:MAG: putative phosphoenolpyruvate-protein phosphotransferase [Actinomycetia bacterium]|nr:putative phosphoenolpyruvate-protein phosphotransferase [Actinomycetes bacterium]